MRADKVREQDNTELRHQLAESQDQLFRLKFQLGMGQMDGLKKYRELKKDRALEDFFLELTYDEDQSPSQSLP